MFNSELLNIFKQGITGSQDQNQIKNKDEDEVKNTLDSELKVLSKYNKIISNMIDFVKNTPDF